MLSTIDWRLIASSIALRNLTSSRQHTGTLASVPQSPCVAVDAQVLRSIFSAPDSGMVSTAPLPPAAPGDGVEMVEERQPVVEAEVELTRLDRSQLRLDVTDDGEHDLVQAGLM